MKKIIAAALSVLVGAFGYTIVDSTIDERVSRLESEVYELREEISNYHPYNQTTLIEVTTLASEINKPSLFPPTPTQKPTAADNSFRVGKVIPKSADSRTKFLIRIHDNGYVGYISPENYSPGGAATVRVAVAQTTNIDLLSPRETTLAASTTVVLDDPREVTLGDPRDDATTSMGYYSSSAPGDYFLCVADSSAVVSTITEGSTSFYDNDYSLVIQPTYNEFTFLITYSGQTDPALAGERIEFNLQLEPHNALCKLVDRSNNRISNDGSFKYTETYRVQNIFYNTQRWIELLKNMSYKIESVELYSQP